MPPFDEILYSEIPMNKAVVLLSGGLDSSTALGWALSEGYSVFTLNFDYGQKHSKELKCARDLAKFYKVPYQLVRFSLPWGGSALLEKKLRVPKLRSLKKIGSGEIPITYVPARNTLFLSFALSYAETLGAGAIIIGANAVDYSGYPDCRPQYMKAVQSVAHLGTKRGVEGKKIKILAPLIHLTKREIILLGTKLNVPYPLTWSCYSGGKKPCGACDSCLLRRKGFEESGRADPIY